MKQLKLKEYRKKAGLTQTDVANALNITQPGYSLWELGKRDPNVHQILELCKLFDCTPNDLFGIVGALQVAIGPYFE